VMKPALGEDHYHRVRHQESKHSPGRLPAHRAPPGWPALTCHYYSFFSRFPLRPPPVRHRAQVNWGPQQMRRAPFPPSSSGPPHPIPVGEIGE
jgi:hypothetical protein